MIKIIIIFLPFLPPSSLLLQSWNWAPFLLQCWLPLCYKNSKPKNNAKTTTKTTATRNHTGKCTNEEGVGHNILGLCLLYLHYDLTVFSLRKQSNSCQLKTHQAGLPMWEVVKIVGEGNMGRGGGTETSRGLHPPMCMCQCHVVPDRIMLLTLRRGVDFPDWKLKEKKERNCEQKEKRERES